MSNPIIELADIDPRIEQARKRPANCKLPVGAVLAAMSVPAGQRRNMPYVVLRQYSDREWALVSTRYAIRRDAEEAADVMNLWRTDGRRFVVVDATPVDGE